MHASEDDFYQIKQELADSECIERCARRFGTIGDPTRMKICYLLRNYPELTVSQIANLAGVSISAASHSLTKLKTADVVRSRRDAKLVYYSLEKNDFTDALLSELGAQS